MGLKIPILEYHDLADGDNPRGAHSPYVLPREKFLAQMKWLVTNGYKMTTFDGINGRNVEGKSVVVSFDDGDQSCFTMAFPILQDLGAVATFFVIAGRAGQINSSTGQHYMTWQEIGELSRHGMRIESHSMTHPYLLRLGDADLKWEIKRSKETIESNIAEEVKYFSIPFGFYSSRVMDAAKEAGYSGIITEDFGYFQPGRLSKSQVEVFPRITIKSGIGEEEFPALIRRQWKITVKHSLYHRALWSAKKILGQRAYVAFRDAFFRLSSSANH